MPDASPAIAASAEPRNSWLPLIVVMMVQVQVSFNAFNVSIQGITKDLGIPASSVGLALTTSTFAMAGFVLLGAKLGAKLGVRRALQIGIVVPALVALTISLSSSGTLLFVAQALQGSSVALAAPALTVLIARNYHGKQQAQAIGFLASAIPLAQVVSLLIAGSFASSIGWRWSFALLAGIGAVNFALSWKLAPIAPNREVAIDWRGAALSSSAIILVSVGFSFLNAWGFIRATDNAPFDIAGLSPVIVVFVVGTILGHAFFRWTRSQMDAGKPVLFSLEVVRSTSERAIVACMALMLFVGTAASFLLPLYMQVVQGLSGFRTSVSIIPYTLSIFVANTLVVRLYGRFRPSQIARVSFLVVAAALTLLAFTIRNDWSQTVVVIGLVTLGLAQGCIVALVFNTLLSSVPKSLAGDVGAFRGLTHNLSGSAGIAVGTALAISLLGGIVVRDVANSPDLPRELTEQVNFDNVDFITNAQLETILEGLDAGEEETAAAIDLYEDARLRALRSTMMVLAMLALLAVLPAGKIPDRREEEITVEDLQGAPAD